MTTTKRLVTATVFLCWLALIAGIFWNRMKLQRQRDANALPPMEIYDNYYSTNQIMLTNVVIYGSPAKGGAR